MYGSATMYFKVVTEFDRDKVLNHQNLFMTQSFTVLLNFCIFFDAFFYLCLADIFDGPGKDVVIFVK